VTIFGDFPCESSLHFVRSPWYFFEGIFHLIGSSCIAEIVFKSIFLYLILYHCLDVVTDFFNFLFLLLEKSLPLFLLDNFVLEVVVVVLANSSW
jgi:hypothetical protein